MLPILRIVPVGGVFLAILILVLALTPPDGARTPLSQRVVTARGVLIDRDEHPEWRQFIIRAALQRADELNRLRELPDTPMRVAPAAPADSQALGQAPEALAPDTPIVSEPATLSEPAALAPGESSDNATRNGSESTIAPSETAQPAAADPAPPAAVESVTAEPPAPVTAEVPRQLAGLPVDRNGSDSAAGEATHSIDAAHGSVKPSETGGTASTGLPVVLPEKRPLAADVPERRMKPVRHRRHTRIRKATAVQPARPLTFLDLLFGTPATQELQALASQPNPRPNEFKK